MVYTPFDLILGIGGTIGVAPEAIKSFSYYIVLPFDVYI